MVRKQQSRGPSEEPAGRAGGDRQERAGSREAGTNGEKRRLYEELNYAYHWIIASVFDQLNAECSTYAPFVTATTLQLRRLSQRYFCSGVWG